MKSSLQPSKNCWLDDIPFYWLHNSAERADQCANKLTNLLYACLVYGAFETPVLFQVFMRFRLGILHGLHYSTIDAVGNCKGKHVTAL
jgi:hypothetical protein